MKSIIDIYICDDDEIFSSKLEKYILSHSDTSRMLNIRKFHSGKELVSAWYEKLSDAVFLDIDMPGLDGFETASKLIESNKNANIIFVTNHDSFVYQVWDYKPFWFIRKSHLESLDEVLTKLYKKIDTDDEKSYSKCFLKAENCVVEIDIGTLSHLESFRHDLILYSSNGDKQTMRLKMSEAEQQLKDAFIVRIQKGIMVNCRFISRVNSREVVLFDGTAIPIGRDRVESVKHIYQEYLRSI